MNSKVKKALPMIIGVLCVIAAMIATVGAGIKIEVGGVSTTGTFTDGMKGDYHIPGWAAAFSLGIIALIAFAAATVMQYLNIKGVKYVLYAGIVCALVSALLFFLAKTTYCSYADIPSEMAKQCSLGIGAIFSGIFMFLSVIAAGYDVIKNK